ncbi:hypothetical protein G7Y89_g13473 [Cudoniella acicularis]|uniref:Zinc finger PHD-type domain-containing protein n=1 Tax=Cudoniella acicularis TaxID=354080 RepID=A0A8H4RAL9_9HELO|nr:hypothetical protein G7Y89_g13473 [Cudoniella acicularis]
MARPKASTKRTKRAKGGACELCRTTYKRCDVYTKTVCLRCHEAGLTCSLYESPTEAPAANKNRKNQFKRVISPPNRARNPSSAMTSHKSNKQTAGQNPNVTTRRSKLDIPKHEESPLATCEICEDEQTNTENSLGWVECEISSCKSWFHVACLLTCNETRRMLFSPSNQLKDSIFICYNCLDRSETENSEEISSAVSRFLQALEKIGLPTRRENIEAKLCPEPISQHKGAPWTEGYQQPSGSLEEESHNITFELASQERYQGFEETIIRNLIRQIHEAIFNYDFEVRVAAERFEVTTNEDLRFRNPLAAWEFVDPGKNSEAGHPWFELDAADRKHPMAHAPITAVLRSMLRSPSNVPLDIDLDMQSLTFSQVHIGLITWFVFDILNNKIDLYNLPNMGPLRAMRSAVFSAAGARWPGSAIHLLREVELRTWEKPEFERQVLLNEKMFHRKLEDFLEPLTKQYRIGHFSNARFDVIVHSLRLWSYLQPLGGMLTMIEPKIGEIFDSADQDAYDTKGTQQFPTKGSQERIRWILSRGFQYEESNLHEPRTCKVKARVVI